MFWFSTQNWQSINRNRISALILGIISSMSIFALFAVVGMEGILSANFYLILSIIGAFNGWCWVITILGFGRKFLNFNNKFLKISNELVLPFYILHETVIVAIAFYIVGLNLIVIAKYLLIILASFAIISILLLPINRINVLGFLFGIKLKK
jgi:glucan biosynthesis protein C